MTSIKPEPGSPVPIANSEVRHIRSATVGQDYLVKIRLPETYEQSTTTYPVLYLLDGDHAFAMATDIVQYLLYGSLIPDLIIVSPAYGSKSTPEFGGTNMRNRDLSPFPLDWTNETPGAAQYYQFFKQELIPYAESTYRIDSTNRTLWGYSLGVLFLLYTLFQDSTLFKNYIALDGFDEHVVELEAAYAMQHSTLAAKLYMVSGTTEGERMSRFLGILKGRNYGGLHLDYAHFDMDHVSVGAAGFTKGLSMTFRP